MKNKKIKKIKQIDCYGIEPKGKGKITFSSVISFKPEPEFKDLGDLGKW
jgi:hypothetical protein